MKFYTSIAICLLLTSGSAVQLEKSAEQKHISEGTQATIDKAVSDVLKIASSTSAPAPYAYGGYSAGMPYPVPVPRVAKVATTHTVHHVHHQAPAKVVYVPKPVPVYVKPATPPPAKAPNSSVMKAIADANQATAMDHVTEQREVASKMEKLEHQAQINESINESVKAEEQKVIEVANKRMAEVHSRKAQEAKSAADAIESAKADSKAKQDSAKKEEQAAINKALSTHASNVVA